MKNIKYKHETILQWINTNPNLLQISLVSINNVYWLILL